MTRADRRSLLRLAAGAALLPLVSAAPLRAAGRSGAAISPPPGPMLYSRRLERGLADGAGLTVSRSFKVLFEREAAGFRVEGTQVAVDVAAPPSLAAFARLEREREELGLFPIALDRHGWIVGAAPDGTPTELDAAVREVSAEFERRPFASRERDELREFVNAVHQKAGRMVALLPLDLFAPVEGRRQETRRVELPGGGAGEVAVLFTAERDTATGLMRTATREVRTELADDLRRTVETWRLEPYR